MAEELYEIAEKIRYEKIGSDTFKGIKENLAENYKENKKNTKNCGPAPLLGWLLTPS